MNLELKKNQCVGKIESAKFGGYADRPFLIGADFMFTWPGGGVGSGGKYTVNVSDRCKWDSDGQKFEMYEKTLHFVRDILEAAGVETVDKLVGLPVVITFKGPDSGPGRCFDSFRIMTEVL